VTGTDSTPPRQHVGQSRLLCLLQEWARVEAEPSRLDVAERLSGWLGAMDTVTLDGALQSIEAYPAQTRKAGEPIDAGALTQRLHRVTLEMSAGLTPAVPIASPLPPRGGRPAEPTTPAPDEAKVTYAPYYQRYLDLQKRMDQQVAALRAELRQALTRGSPGLRQLVALDSVMEQMLGPRAQKLLASVPVFLERRFAYWRQAQERAPQPADRWHQPGGWVHAFEHDMKEMLLAELHLRLRPLQGLVEAAQNEQQKRT
jgi:hypothetical protein